MSNKLEQLTSKQLRLHFVSKVKPYLLEDDEPDCLTLVKVKSEFLHLYDSGYWSIDEDSADSKGMVTGYFMDVTPQDGVPNEYDEYVAPPDVINNKTSLLSIEHLIKVVQG